MSYCCIQVAEDPIFARDGADVYVESNITFTQVRTIFLVHVPHCEYSYHLYVGNFVPKRKGKIKTVQRKNKKLTAGGIPFEIPPKKHQ